MERYITEENLTAFRECISRQGKNDSTVDKYIRDMQKLERYVDGRMLTRELLQGYIPWLLEEGYQPRSINAYLAAANAFFQSMEWKDLMLTPLKLERTEPEDEEGFSEEEYRRLFLEAKKQDERMALLMKVLGMTELRVTELEYLTVNAVQEGKVYPLRKNRPHLCRIPQRLQRELLSYIERAHITEGIVFCTSRGHVIHRANIARKIKELCISANIDPQKGNVRNLKRKVFPDLEMDFQEQSQEPAAVPMEPESDKVEEYTQKIQQMKEEIRQYEEKIIWLKGMEAGRSEGALQERVQAIRTMISMGIPRERILERYTQEEYDRAMLGLSL